MKDKINLIKSINEQLEVAQFEEVLQSNPLTNTQIQSLPAGVKLQAMDYIKELRDNGLVVPDPMPTMDEFRKANPNAVFVIRESEVAQMTTEQFRKFRQSGLLQSDKVGIYPDIEPGQAVVHYNYFNKNGTTHSTGANETMIRVVFKDLDEKASEMNYQLVVDANDYYQTAKTTIEHLMMSLEGIKDGTFQSQYAF